MLTRICLCAAVGVVGSSIRGADDIDCFDMCALAVDTSECSRTFCNEHDHCEGIYQNGADFQLVWGLIDPPTYWNEVSCESALAYNQANRRNVHIRFRDESEDGGRVGSRRRLGHPHAHDLDQDDEEIHTDDAYSRIDEIDADDDANSDVSGDDADDEVDSVVDGFEDADDEVDFVVGGLADHVQPLNLDAFFANDSSFTKFDDIRARCLAALTTCVNIWTLAAPFWEHVCDVAPPLDELESAVNELFAMPEEWHLLPRSWSDMNEFLLSVGALSFILNNPQSVSPEDFMKSKRLFAIASKFNPDISSKYQELTASWEAPILPIHWSVVCVHCRGYSTSTVLPEHSIDNLATSMLSGATPQGVLAHLVHFLSRVESFDEYLCTNLPVFEFLQTNFEAGFSKISSRRNILSRFARKCSQYLKITHKDIERYLNAELTVLQRHQYPVSPLFSTEQDATSETFLPTAIEWFNIMDKLDFIHPFSPQVTFTDSPASGNGPRKEWISKLIRVAFDPANGYFEYSDERNLYVTPTSVASISLHHYRQIGRMVGLGVKDGLSMEISLTPACVSLLHGGNAGLFNMDEFLYTHDPQYATDTLKLKHDFIGNAFVPGLFEFPNGEPLTDSSKINEYIAAVRNDKLFPEHVISRMTMLLAGIYDVLPYGILEYYTIQHIDHLLRGDVTPISTTALRTMVEYIPKSAKDYPEVAWLWELLDESSEEQLEAFLSFISSAPRPPINAAELGEWMQITFSHHSDRMPKSQTCFKQLILSRYKDKETLKKLSRLAFDHCKSMERK